MGRTPTAVLATVLILAVGAALARASTSVVSSEPNGDIGLTVGTSAGYTVHEKGQ